MAVKWNVVFVFTSESFRYVCLHVQQPGVTLSGVKCVSSLKYSENNVYKSTQITADF